MITNTFLGFSLLGAEWVMFLLLLISVGSVAVMLERWMHYRQATRGLEEYRENVRKAVLEGDLTRALKLSEDRKREGAADLETGLTHAILAHKQKSAAASPSVLGELAQDEVLRSKVLWEKNLAVLATVGNNAPFIGLFGTVLGIIKAFHDLSQQTTQGAQTVSAGISEALVATAVGILVAIPAVIAFNIFSRKVKAAMTQAEAMKSFLVGKLAG